MSDELYQSHLRMVWAQGKINELESLVYRASETALKSSGSQVEAERLLIVFGFQDHVTYDSCRIISEFVLHARAALDYVVFTLSRLNTGVDQDGTQFPINSCPEHFESSRIGCLRFLTKEQIAVVESVQPYKGFPLMDLLKQISNFDKHRNFVKTSVMGTVRRSDTDAETMVPAFDVLLDDGTPAVETLQILQTHIADLLGRFDTFLK